MKPEPTNWLAACAVCCVLCVVLLCVGVVRVNQLNSALQRIESRQKVEAEKDERLRAAVEVILEESEPPEENARSVSARRTESSGLCGGAACSRSKRPRE